MIVLPIVNTIRLLLNWFRVGILTLALWVSALAVVLTPVLMTWGVLRWIEPTTVTKFILTFLLAVCIATPLELVGCCLVGFLLYAVYN